MKSGSSIALRAAVALVLMVGFYLLALGIAGGLLYLPYAEMRYANRIHIKLALLCVVGAAAILWSVLPRIDRFPAPGPVLSRRAHPRLFAELEGIARATRQAMPAEVFLVADLNAWVAQRGGVMGFGSRRVMGLGLPLLRALRRSEFRAVLAHEFGHFHGGDTKLGPWVYKTRNAIGRTVHALRGEDGGGSLLQLPFLWYGRMFLRVTHAVSRHQEFVADALAARVAGARPLTEGLRKVHGVAPAFEAYWQNEAGPVLQAGFLPPLAEGFAAFLRARPVAEAVRKQLADEIKRGKTDPYDTHPPLRERIAAVRKLPPGETVEKEAPALALLDDVPALELQLLAELAGHAAARKLERIGWGQVVEKVYVPNWQRLVKDDRQGLAGLRPEDLPALAKDEEALAKRFAPGVPKKHRAALGAAVVGAALTLLLRERKWAIHAGPGDPVTARKDEESLRSFDVLEVLARDEIAPEDWRARCDRWGITGCDLGER